VICLAAPDDVTLVFLGPGLDGTAGLPDADLIALAGHAVYTGSLEFQVILYGPKEAGDLLRRQARRLDVLGQHPADAVNRML
jgi:hypothetical protein